MGVNSSSTIIKEQHKTIILMIRKIIAFFKCRNCIYRYNHCPLYDLNPCTFTKKPKNKKI